MSVKTKWISVKFELPEAGEEVVVLRGGGGAYYARYTGCDGFVQGGGLGFLDVTHWMPYPEPPQEMPKPGAFHILVGDLACPADRVYHSETGREICQLLDTDLAQRICVTLNQLWQQDKGTSEDEHIDNANPLKCLHCKGALRLEQYVSYLAIRGTKVCPHCNKVMEIGQRLVKVNG